MFIFVKCWLLVEVEEVCDIMFDKKKKVNLFFIGIKYEKN